MKQCKSHLCRKCQKPHHTLLLVDKVEVGNPLNVQNVVPVSTSIASGVSSALLLMTCHICVEAHDGSAVEVRALLDSVLFYHLHRSFQKD